MNRVLRLRLVRAPLAFGIALFTMAQILSVGAGAVLPDPPPTNPFDLFGELAPGVPLATINQLPCEYRYNFPPVQGPISYCMHIPDHDLIEWISISAKNGVIERVTFGVRLRYGDLVALFGQAQEKRQYPTIASFEWDTIYASGSIPRASRLSMLTPISRVVFRLADL
jgi:hypothetical protein